MLRGDRVSLRPVRPEDLERLAAILAEPEISHWWGADAAATARDLVEEGEDLVFGIEVDGKLVGSIQAHEERDPDYRHAALDVFLTATLHGRGLGPEALFLLASHLIGERRHHRLTIDPRTENVRAIRAYERVGFRPVGVMRAYERAADGTWHDGLLMELLAGELRRPGRPSQPHAPS